jgi:hypothetical protein
MLNSNSLKILNIKNLRLFCKHANIKCSRMPKETLFENYNRFLACKVIQRCFRNHFYKNAEDSISLEPVKYPCFIYRTKFGKCFFYSYETIIKYIMKTGDTRDPMTRNVYSDEDLLRLDSEVKKYFPEIRYSSTLKIKKNINYAKRIRNRENEILAFQTYLEELKTKIIIVIESGAFLWEQFEITVDSVEYYSIHDYIATVLDKMRSVYRSLKNHDSFSANCFKENIIESVSALSNSAQSNDITNILNFIKLI